MTGVLRTHFVYQQSFINCIEEYKEITWQLRMLHFNDLQIIGVFLMKDDLQNTQKIVVSVLENMDFLKSSSFLNITMN